MQKTNGEIEVRIQDSAGVFFWYSLHLFLQQSNTGDVTSALGALRNIDDSKRMEEHMNLRLSAQLEGAQDYFQHLKSTQEKILLYHHDMRHSLKLMEQLAAQGDADALRAHSLLAQEQLQAIAPNHYCGNDTVNLICGSFDQLAQKENVQFSCHITLPSKLSLTNFELCTIFFNLLENALFAAKELPATEMELRKIQIDAYINHQKLVITAKNGYVGDICIENNLPVSQKQSEEHGLGIRSIVSVVNAHNGIYLFKTEEQMFIANLLLSL